MVKIMVIVRGGNAFVEDTVQQKHGAYTETLTDTVIKNAFIYKITTEVVDNYTANMVMRLQMQSMLLKFLSISQIYQLLFHMWVLRSHPAMLALVLE